MSHPPTPLEQHVSSAPAPTPPNAPEPARPAPILTQHTALVLLAAIVIGLVVGALTFLNGTPAPGAVLAGLLAVGAGIPVLRALIG
ncbi:hypothetical protein TUSST3_30730 [Streptomyces sp. TUS-ST3]|jgi:hypothetical protein|nr:hypothetical protein TUSST3_30730 [Streptomyces sp. TUS-ST3]